MDDGRVLRDTLVSSVSKRARELLALRIEAAHTARERATMGQFFEARSAAGRDHLVNRADMYRLYSVAKEQGMLAVEAIIGASIEAGARDEAIQKYAEHDFCFAVNAFMMSSFGHGPRGSAEAGRIRELQSLEANTKAEARAIAHRIAEFRAKVEQTRPTELERMKRWLLKRKVVAAIVLLFGVFGATGVVALVERIARLIQGH